MKCKCKHKSTTGYMWRAHRFDGRAWIFDWQRAFTQPGDLKHHDRVICDSCGSWLSLGEANDTPEAMVELRAAEIAVAFTGGEHTTHCMDAFEQGGWLMQKLLADAAVSDQLEWGAPNSGSTSGYLARCIATHDATHSEDA